MIEMNKNGYWPSTPNTNLLYGLSEACDMLLAEGLDTVFARHQLWAAGVRAAVTAWGLPIQCADPEYLALLQLLRSSDAAIANLETVVRYPPCLKFSQIVHIANVT